MAASRRAKRHVGVRSGDGGRTWKPSSPSGTSEFGTFHDRLVLWAVDDRRPERGLLRWLVPPRGRGTVSLTVTLDGGRHFRRCRVPKLTGFQATGIRVVGHNVTITAKSRLSTGRRRRTVTVEIR
jgi:hypothetical protein